MAEKLFPLTRGGRFYCDADHEPESLLFGSIPSALRSFVKRPFNLPTDSEQWIIRQEQAKELNATPSGVFDALADTPYVVWLGHSSFLIHVRGVTVITDPIFDRPSIMYPRIVPCGISPEQLPPIHAILISHNHRDHMDEQSLLRLKQLSANRVQVLVPMGDKRWFDKRGFAHVSECEWEQEQTISAYDSSHTLRTTFVPARHWSRRGLFDKNKSLWGGWVIHNDATQIYFAGDTAYWYKCFARIKHLFPQLDLALMPIGPGEPRSWMQHSHVDAFEAGQAFLDVNARCMIPMHWGTFSFGNDRFDAPLQSIRQWWDQNTVHVQDKHLAILKVGQRFDLPASVATVNEGDKVATEHISEQQL